MSEAINSQSALPVGTELLHYRLSGELGRGGFGYTYKAQDTKLNRAVVIKEYLPLDLAGRQGDYTIAPHSLSQADNFRSGLDSFLKEAQTLAKFHQPNIVPVLDYFQGNGTAYLVMPYLEGQTLADRLARQADGRMSEAEVRAWLIPVLDGLQTIHAAGYLHRDLKPDNIFLQANGNPILIDFGAARNALANRSRSLSVVLTPGYAPAEQYSATAANQGPWTDLYALGAVILRCLTGSEPTDSTERQDTVTNGEPDPLVPQLRNLTGVASPGLVQAVEGCLRVARKNRLQGVVELRQILDDRQTLESESVKPNLTEVTVDIPTAPRNKKMAVRISLAIGALLLISFSFYAYNRQASAPEPTPPVTVAPATPVTPATPTPKVAEPAATTPTTPERIAHAQTYTNSLGMEFVLIPAGTFMMGSPPDDKSVPSDEKPAHQVTISRPFYMGQYEVTQAQWEEVMGSNPSFFKGRNNPVEQVSWEDAQEFIKRLNQMEGTNKYRLPTEAEWEYAARAGTQTRYYFGDSEKNLGEYAWYDDNSNDETHPVGQKKPNAWGLYDMAGNVWEWVEDWYDSDYYSRSPGLDPPGPERGLSRVQRGGGWINFTTLCQSALRDDYNPGNRYLTLGFRLALSDSSVAKDEQAIVQPAADQGAVSSSLPQSPTNSLGMDFVLIPAGEFMMGSENGDRTEKPVHRVSISQAFYLGKYEVTQEEWEAVMGNNPSYFKGRKNPVEQVSYRLPTEAEWEYAARAGTTTDYSFGDDVGQLGNYAWFGDNSGKTTHPVGQKKPNPWGLYDMHGNVLE